MSAVRYQMVVSGLLLIIILLVSCNRHTPKPAGYFRIETGEPQYQPYNHERGFSFQHSTKSVIEPSQKENWFNIFYPAFNARIHCSYMNISPSDYDAAVEDSRKFVYRHTVMAEDIRINLFENPDACVAGILYEIDGEVASPVQFILSDSSSYFFRGALYFNFSPNEDSIAPVLNFIKKDISALMETFQADGF